MKFNCGKTYKEKQKAKTKWHKWFAWYPVRISSNECRWLETVMRKGQLECYYSGCDWEYEYKPIK